MIRQIKITKSLTNRDSASIEKYFSELNKEPMIDQAEEVELAIKIQGGDKEALDRLVRANLRFVVSVAKQYQNRGLSLADLINEGNIGLIKAAGRFDHTRGFKFISFAVWNIRQAIMQAVAEQTRMVRIPLNQVNGIRMVSHASEKLEQQLERKPTVEELAEIMGYSDYKIENLLRIAGKHISVDENIGGEDDERTLINILENKESPSPDAGMLKTSLQIEIEHSLSTLKPREKSVLKDLFGIGIPHPLSMMEVANKYEIHKERVRQIKDTSIKKLRHISRSKNLKAYLG